MRSEEGGASKAAGGLRASKKAASGQPSLEASPSAPRVTHLWLSCMSARQLMPHSK